MGFPKAGKLMYFSLDLLQKQIPRQGSGSMYFISGEILGNMVRDQGSETGKGGKPNKIVFMSRLLFWAQPGFSPAGNFLGNWGTPRIVPLRGKQLV